MTIHTVVEYSAAQCVRDAGFLRRFFLRFSPLAGWYFGQTEQAGSRLGS